MQSPPLPQRRLAPEWPRQPKLLSEGNKRHNHASCLDGLDIDRAFGMGATQHYQPRTHDRAKKWSHATHVRRQPGLVAKLFAYLVALERGLTPERRVSDDRLSVGGRPIRNFDDRFLR